MLQAIPTIFRTEIFISQVVDMYSAVELEREFFGFLGGSVGLVSVVGYQLRGFEPCSGLH